MDPIRRLRLDLFDHDEPDFAWVVEWSATGQDPVTAAWHASRDLGAMILLAQRWEDPKKLVAIACDTVRGVIPRDAPAYVWNALHRAEEWTQGRGKYADLEKASTTSVRAFQEPAQSIGKAAKACARAADLFASGADNGAGWVFVAIDEATTAASWRSKPAKSSAEILQDWLPGIRGRIRTPTLADVLPKEP